GVSAHCATSNHATFDQRMRIVAQNFTVFTCTRLGFVSINYKIMRTSVALLGHEGPFKTRWETSSAASTQSGGFHFLNDPITAFFDEPNGVIPMATRHCTF